MSSNAALVEDLAASGHVRTEAVRQALLSVDRALFLPGHEGEAYEDRPVAIGGGQTISAPHMVAIMAEALELAPGHRVLEVGGGSGYHAAVLARLVAPEGRVVAVEILPELAARARQNLARAGLASSVEVLAGDGSLGAPDRAPFDRVSVACAAPSIPPPLLGQLREGGLAVVPVGTRHEQTLVRARKGPGGRIGIEDLGGCVFVPLRGAFGFPDGPDRLG
ncbi:MAG TPA: protein-L-isoaspartate(D-aspartate) O-methyltransferase [Candidatus Thermoplasmatota archaeon]|nr:protein-L-isoaspartate(D-aspartate) O-methyltransferase [Candidatus Thermoplasmatota archaeon]